MRRVPYSVMSWGFLLLGLSILVSQTKLEVNVDFGGVTALDCESVATQFIDSVL